MAEFLPVLVGGLGSTKNCWDLSGTMAEIWGVVGVSLELQIVAEPITVHRFELIDLAYSFVKSKRRSRLCRGACLCNT